MPASVRRRAAAAPLAVLLAVALAPAALASHADETVDCGSAGTFTARAVDTGAGDHQAPEPSSVIVFEEGGVLTVKEFWVNGQLRFAIAGNGRAQNAVSEVTCTFANEAGVLFRVVGILNAG